MTALDLLNDLTVLGVVLTADGGKLIYDAPVGAMTPELIGRLKSHKAEVLAILDLSRPQEGWTPEGWRDHLLFMADRCQDVVPNRAKELRRAAAAMTLEACT